jgi:hypothetical protein
MGTMTAYFSNINFNASKEKCSSQMQPVQNAMLERARSEG